MTRDVSISKEQARYEGTRPLLSPPLICILFPQERRELRSASQSASLALNIVLAALTLFIVTYFLVWHATGNMVCGCSLFEWSCLYQATATIWGTLIALVAFMAEVWLFVIRASRIDAEIERREKAARKKVFALKEARSAN